MEWFWRCTLAYTMALIIMLFDFYCACPDEVPYREWNALAGQSIILEFVFFLNNIWNKRVTINYTVIFWTLLAVHPHHLLPIGPVINIYNTKVGSSMLYGAELWGFSNLSSLTVAHNKFLRSVTGLPQTTPLVPLHLDLGCNNLGDQARFRPIALWRKIWTTPELTQYALALNEVRSLNP